MTGEELVAALARGLCPNRPPCDTHREEAEDAVRRVAEQRAAEELLAVAERLDAVGEAKAIGRYLRARAAALTATDHGRNAT